MKRLFKILRITKGFTLMECVMAVLILAATCAILLPALSTSYRFIITSQSLDNLTSIAEEKALSYPYIAPNTDMTTDSKGVSYGYSKGFHAQVYFDVQDDVAVEFDPRTYKMVATIVKDSRGNLVVIYDIDPNELKRIFAREYYNTSE